MPKRYSSAQITKVLLREGFRFVSQKGSHAKYVKGTNIVIIVANKREIPNGTFSSILRQSGLKRGDFDKK